MARRAQQRLKGKHSNQAMVEFGNGRDVQECAEKFKVLRWVSAGSTVFFLPRKEGWDGRKHRDEGKWKRLCAERAPSGSLKRYLHLKTTTYCEEPRMIQSGLCGESRGMQAGSLMYPEMILKKTLMKYYKRDVPKSDEKSLRKSAPHRDVRSARGLIARDRAYQYVHHHEE